MASRTPNKFKRKARNIVTVGHARVTVGGPAMVGQVEIGILAGVRRTGVEPRDQSPLNDPGETIDVNPQSQTVGATQEILRP